MPGFSIMDESHAFSGFRRGKVKALKGFYLKAASSGYDWVSSLFDQDTITDGTNHITDSSSVDNWNGGGGYPRRANSRPWKNSAFPFVDTSGSSPALKLVHCGHTDDSADDFGEATTGAQIAVFTGQTANNTLACVTSTGVEFSGGDMVDGDHVIQWRFTHDAKSDTLYSITAVLSCASNVLTAYVKWLNHNSTYPAYTSAADTKVDANREWQATWDSSNNTWTINVEDDLFDGANDAAVGMRASGGKLTKYTDDYDIAVSGSGAGYGPSDDDRMWEIEVG